MLGIVLSCNIVEFQGKLMNQTWENGKNLEKTKIRAAKIYFFSKILLRQSLDIITSYTRKN